MSFKEHQSKESPWVSRLIKERKNRPNYAGNFVCRVAFSFIGPDGTTHMYNHYPYNYRPFDLQELAWVFKRAEEMFGVEVELDEDIRELVDDITE